VVVVVVVIVHHPSSVVRHFDVSPSATSPHRDPIA
jgi:hypothetical protein